MATTAVTSGGTLSVTQYQGEYIAKEARKIDWLAANGIKGKDENSCIQIVDDLEKGKGDSVLVYLLMKGTGAGQDSDNTLEGNEESIVSYSQQVYLGQKRHAFRLDGALTEQRTKINLRKAARANLSTWFGEWSNELAMIMLSGTLGVNTNGVIRSGSSFLGNSLTTPDSDHLVYANSANLKASMTAADVLTLNWIDTLVTKAMTLSPQVRPMKVNGEDKYLLIIHPYQARDLRNNTSSGQWMDLQKAAMQGGKVDDNPIFKGKTLGEYNGVIIKVSQDVRTFSDYGGGSVTAARALFLGAQAGFEAYGQGHSDQYKYVEKTFDYDNQVGFAGACIKGIQKARFNSKDYGVIALDTAAAA
jgi:N4-gp56 family major capsid protein